MPDGLGDIMAGGAQGRPALSNRAVRCQKVSGTLSRNPHLRAPLIPDPRPPIPACFRLDFALR
jgi:hypothetical protein